MESNEAAEAPGLGEMRWSGSSQHMPHTASPNSRGAKIGKPAW